MEIEPGCKNPKVEGPKSDVRSNLSLVTYHLSFVTYKHMGENQ